MPNHPLRKIFDVLIPAKRKISVVFVSMPKTYQSTIKKALMHPAVTFYTAESSKHAILGNAENMERGLPRMPRIVLVHSTSETPEFMLHDVHERFGACILILFCSSPEIGIRCMTGKEASASAFLLVPRTSEDTLMEELRDVLLKLVEKRCQNCTGCTLCGSIPDIIRVETMRSTVAAKAG